MNGQPFTPELSAGWAEVYRREADQPYFRELQEFVARERATDEVFPESQNVYRALELTPLEETRVLLLGQDPYHGAGQAHGLCFSVAAGVKPPPSLANIFNELEADLGIAKPDHGCLEAWARRGVLLLNTVLTVRAQSVNSHRKQGWEQFTDALIAAVNARPAPCVFVLWGRPAQKKRSLVDADRHTILEAAHPSPLSAHRGFLGTRPFSTINQALAELGYAPIDWTV